jgi:hypothetical protein
MSVRQAHALGRLRLLNRLLAPSLRVLEHCNQHHDHDRHDRRAGSEPDPRETTRDPQREPDQHAGDTATQPAKNGPRLTACQLVAAI